MTSEELEREYQRQAGLANVIGLSVPVALQLQTVILLKQILDIVSRPPMIVQSPSDITIGTQSEPPTKKAPKA